MTQKLLKKQFQFAIISVALTCFGIAGGNAAFAANSINGQGGFLDRKAEGWFWYKDPLELENSEPELEPIEDLMVVITKEETSQDEELDTNKVFSTAWLRESMPKYLDLAIDEPSVQNVQAYMYLQRLMMDKAERFALSTQRVVSGDPMLDESVRRPLASFAIQGLDQKAGRNKFELVKSIANTAGLFFFFSSNCEECAIQAPLIKNVMDNYGFAVVPISLDGKNLANSPFEEFKTDEGQAQMLDVRHLPAMYLATADGQFELVGQSIYSLPELADRIIFAASRKSLITQEQLNDTRPILDSTNIAEILDFSNSQEENMSDIEAGKVNSKELLQYINTALKDAQYEN